MKNIALIAIPVALALAAGTWFFLDKQNGENPLATGAQSGNAAAVVATVNGTDITEGDVNEISAQLAAQQGADPATLDAGTNAQLRELAIDQLISRELLVQATAQANITVDEEQVAAELAAIREQFETEEEYQAALDAENLTADRLEEQVRESTQLNAYLAQTLNFDAITVSEEEVQDMYDTQIAAAAETSGTSTPALPPLEEVREQVEQMLIQQKQQAAIAAHIESLTAAASIERTGTEG